MKKETILILSIAFTIVVLSFDYKLTVMSFDEGKLTVSLGVLFTPVGTPSFYFYGPTGFVKSSSSTANIYEFDLEERGFLIPLLYAKNYYGHVMTKANYPVINLDLLCHRPQITVMSDVKENEVYKYIKLDVGSAWRLTKLSIDGTPIVWFKRDGYIVAFTKKEFKNGVHELNAVFDLPYGARKSITWKLFSLNGVIVKYRGDVMPYIVENVKPYEYRAKLGETLWKIARKFGIRVGDLILINDIKDPKMIYAGQKLKIGRVKFIDNPTVIVVNLRTARMGLYYDGVLLKVYPIAVGRGDSTPPGKYWILRKEVNPALYWYGEYIAPSPVNGLGTRYLQLSNPEYGIHGTSKPWEIGRRISHGCIRMFNRDVEELDSFAGVGSTVITINVDKDFKKNLVDMLEGYSLGKMAKKTGRSSGAKR